VKVADFARYLGFWLAEGKKMRGQYGNSVVITQTKSDGILWADEMFGRLGWPVSRTIRANGETAWRVVDKGLKEWLIGCQGEGHELLIPDEVFLDWNQEEMAALLEGLMVGDGTWHSQNGWHSRYSTTSYRLAGDVQRLMAHVGEATGRVRRQYQAGSAQGGRYRANHDLWSVDVDHSQTSRLHASQLRQVDYDDMVYCLTVPNSTLLVRRQGVAMWCGNCVMVVAVDLLSDALDSYDSRMMTASAYGSTDMAGLKSGREFERISAIGAGPARPSGREQLDNDKLERIRGRRSNDSRNRLNSIYSRGR